MGFLSAWVTNGVMAKAATRKSLPEIDFIAGQTSTCTRGADYRGGCFAGRCTFVTGITRKGLQGAAERLTGTVQALIGSTQGRGPGSGFMGMRMKKLKGFGVSGLVLGLVGGCAALPPTEPVAEKLDPDTAVTVTVLSQPIELYSQTSRSKQTDPFAYLAPFETNRMGKRELFLWVSTPQAQGALVQPQVMCNGQAVELKPLAQDGAGAVAVEAGKVIECIRSWGIELTSVPPFSVIAAS